MLFKAFLVRNIIIKYIKRQFKKLKKDKGYSSLLKERKLLLKENKSLKEVNENLNAIRESYGLSKTSLEKFAKPLAHKYKNYLSSQMVQVIYNDCYTAFEKVIFSNGKEIHFKKYDDIMCLKCKKIDNGFTFKSIMDGNVEDLNPYSLRYGEKIRKKQNSLNRKLTTNNQDKIENGKFKKGCKLDFSKNAKKDKKKLKTLQRKKKETDKQYKCKIANEILQNCDNIYIEPTNFNALKKRSKKTERSDKISIVKGKTVYKYKKKKRFGSTVQNKAPSKFLNILEYKCKYLDIPVTEIDTKSFKASQYNHQTDKFFKKNLNQRWNMLDFDDETKVFVQRDLYSAFLIKNSDSTLMRADKNKCNKEFKRFVYYHDECIKEVKVNNNNRLSCFGF